MARGNPPSTSTPAPAVVEPDAPEVTDAALDQSIEIADLRDEVAGLRAEVEALKSATPAGSMTADERERRERITAAARERDRPSFVLSEGDRQDRIQIENAVRSAARERERGRGAGDVTEEHDITRTTSVDDELRARLPELREPREKPVPMTDGASPNQAVAAGTDAPSAEEQEQARADAPTPGTEAPASVDD